MSIINKQHLAFSVVFLGSLLAASCGAVVERNTSSGATGGGGNTNATGATGAGPECQDGQFDCDGQELKFCGGGQSFHFKTCDTTEICDAASGDCSCKLGDKRCAGVESAQECVMGTGGVNEFSTTKCVFPATCNPPSGECEIDSPPCILGDTMCDADGDTVLHCQLDGSNKPDWIPIITCSKEGYENHCQFIQAEVSDPKRLCMNACNVRGVPLAKKLCSPAGDPFCAKNICNSSGTDLIPDHTDCRGGGQSCSRDEDCLSCICDSQNLCFSNTYNACGIANLICK